MEVYNQFKLALKKSSISEKRLNLQIFAHFSPTSTANFGHILIFLESLFAQDHFGTTNIKIHPVLKEINIAPRN